jgi:Protein of unknown function with HXXEE motif
VLGTALFAWPYAALALGVAGMLALVIWPRPVEAPSRWRDPAWLVCLLLPVYMVHQFEEHGVNVLGQRYHFLSELCAAIGHKDVRDCPAGPAFIFAVNVGGVWLAGLLAIVFRRRNILVGACAVGLLLVNAVIHIGQALFHHSYDSGLLTALVLFVPLCGWTLHQLLSQGILDTRRVVLVVATGVVMHAALLASLFAHGAGLLSETSLLVLNVLNGLWVWPFGSLARRMA